MWQRLTMESLYRLSTFPWCWNHKMLKAPKLLQQVTCHGLSVKHYIIMVDLLADYAYIFVLMPACRQRTSAPTHKISHVKSPRKWRLQRDLWIFYSVGSTKYIFEHEGKMPVAVWCQLPAHQGIVYPFKPYIHLPTKLYSSGMSVALEIVQVD